MTTKREYDRDLSAEEKTFLRMVHDPARRADLLERLAELGLLPAFLEAEGGVSA
jgi:hypothetical protein